MKINFYFEFPQGIDPDNEQQPPESGQGWCSNYAQPIALILLYRSCKRRYPGIQFKAINSVGFDKDGNFKERIDGNGNIIPNQAHHSPSGLFAKYSWPHLIIENEENKKYLLVTYGDQLRHILNPGQGWDFENCVEIFPAVGVQQDERGYQPIDHNFITTKFDPTEHALNLILNYTPISYPSLFKTGEDSIQEIYKSRHVDDYGSIPEKPVFRGHPGYGQTDIPTAKEFRGHFRNYLTHKEGFPGDDRFEMHSSKLMSNAFMEELAHGSFNIDINGAAEVSCRTVEIMGLGRALIRPKVGLKFHNELIPDYHYAAVKCNDLSDYKTLADAYIERWEDLKKDYDLVKFLSDNGRKWYEENATIEAHVKILEKLLDLNKLI